MSEKSPISFRITHETKVKLNKIKEELKVDQNSAMEELIRVYELHRERSLANDGSRYKAIKDFEHQVLGLTQAYLMMQNQLDNDFFKMLEDRETFNQINSKIQEIDSKNKKIDRLEIELETVNGHLKKYMKCYEDKRNDYNELEKEVTLLKERLKLAESSQLAMENKRLQNEIDTYHKFYKDTLTEIRSKTLLK